MVNLVPLANLGHTGGKCLVLEKDGEVGTSTDYTKSDELINATELGKLFGYIYCDESWREIVLIATRRIIYDLCGDVISPIALEFSSANRGTEELLPSSDSVTINSMARFLVDLDRSASRSN